MASVCVSAWVDVDVDLEDIDIDDLINELERRRKRGLTMNNEYVSADDMREFLEKIWEKKRTGQDFNYELEQLIYHGLGKIL
jgi:hypothetical protein